MKSPRSNKLKVTRPSRLYPPEAYDRHGKLYPPEAYDPVTGNLYARARLKNPDNPKQFYKQSGKNGKVWVETGYDSYLMDVWLECFGSQQPDGRPWEFYGEMIDIWPDEQEK